MTEDDFNAIAWRDFVAFAWGEPGMREAFTAATSMALMPAARSPIEAMVDIATDAQAKALEAFIEWVTRTHWGIDHAPKAYRDTLAKRTGPE